MGIVKVARDIARFNPHIPAPMNEAKAQAIDACVSDIERALIDLRDGTSAPLMTATAITG